MTRLRRLLDLCIGSVCAVLLAALVVVLCWQVFSRYALGTPSTLTEETLRFGVIWLSLLGAAYATGQGTHMAIDLARDITTGRARQVLEMLVPVAFIIFAVAVLILGGMRGMEIASRQLSPVLRVPMGWVYASLPVSGGLMILYSLLNLIDLARGTRPRPAGMDKALSAVE